MKSGKILLILAVGLAISLFFVFDLQQYLSIEYFQSQRKRIADFRQTYPFQAATFFVIAYVMMAALSLPGAAIFTLAAGAIFGFWTGALIVSFASTMGAACAFLISRYLLRDFVQSRFEQQLISINRGIGKDGAFYLFAVRLVPIFPFFIVNLVMGVMPIKTWTFIWVSLAGMFPAGMVYVNAGTQLGQLESLRDILSPGIIFSFVLLGLFPLIARKILTVAKANAARLGGS